MRDEELIIGYDVRDVPADSASRWDNKRKVDFLYRLDVKSPLSTDISVWPSLLQEFSDFQFVGHQGLWSDLSAVVSHLNENGSHSANGWIVALTLLIESCNPNQLQEWKTLLPIVMPSIHDEAWSFLGYDVSDMWLLSALSNCGFLPNLEDAESLRDEWGPKLNDYHLFEEPHKALMFKDAANSRIREHAEFLVFGLWLIQP